MMPTLMATASTNDLIHVSASTTSDTSEAATASGANHPCGTPRSQKLNARRMKPTMPATASVFTAGLTIVSGTTPRPTSQDLSGDIGKSGFGGMK